MRISRIVPRLLILVLFLAISGQAFASTGVNLDLKGAELKDVLRILSKIGNVNIIVDESVTGKVDLCVDGEPFDSILDKLIRLNGFAYKKDGKTYLVTTPAKMQDFEPTGSTQIIKLNYATVGDVKKALVGVLADNKVQTDTRTNSLVISGTPAEISQVQKIVTTLDVKPRKVTVEAKIVSVRAGVSRDLGIDWTTFGQFQAGILGRWKTAEGYGQFVDGKDDPEKDAGFGLIAKLSALESKGDANILASPKIAMDDGKPAKILSGERLPFVVIDKDGNQTAQFIDVGVRLEITTQILSDDLITAAIRPEVSSLVGWVQGRFPQIETREASTTISLKDGQTMVLGGLLQEDSTKDIYKLPVLGDLPVLGKIFQHETSSKKKTELLIFITPKIERE